MAGQRFNSGQVSGWGKNPLSRPSLTSTGQYGLPNVTFYAQTTWILYTDRLIYAPFYVDQPVTVTSMTYTVTSASAAGTVVRMGICSWDAKTNGNSPGGLPNEIILDAGTAASDSLGQKEITGLTTLLNPGWYATMCISTGTPTLRALRYSSLPGGFPNQGDGRWGALYTGTGNSGQQSGFSTPLPVLANADNNAPAYVGIFLRWSDA